MRNKPKVEVGERLLAVNRRYKTFTDVEVCKVGRKYFYCRPVDVEYPVSGFLIEDWKPKPEDGFTNSYTTLYKNRQDYDKQEEKRQLIAKIKQEGQFNLLSIDELRQIWNYLNNAKNDN